MGKSRAERKTPQSYAGRRSHRSTAEDPEKQIGKIRNVIDIGKFRIRDYRNFHQLSKVFAIT